MLENETVQSEGVSTELSSDEVTSTTTPDADADLFGDIDSLLGGGEDESPRKTKAEDAELEGSGEEEDLTTPDDDSVEDNDESDEEDGEEYSLIDFSEMQKHRFEIGGKDYSANDLKAALGQLSKQKEDLDKVEAAQTKLDQDQAKFAASQERVHLGLATDQSRQVLNNVSNQINHLMAQQQQAAAAGNDKAFTQIQMRLQPLQAQAQQLTNEINLADRSAGAKAAQELPTLGFGDLLTDPQRREAFKDYAKKSVPAHLVKTVNAHPELLVLVEKARLHDKGNDDLAKGKLTGTKSSVKNKGATKKTNRKTNEDNHYGDIDAMFAKK